MRPILFLILLLSTLLPTSLPAAAAPPNQGTPGQIMALINEYRAQNGLPAYTTNDTLMQIAQGQADYLGSIVQTSDVHAGPGGSRPRDRAYAAGYGEGEQFFITEIGVYGLGMTPEEAISWWKQSPDHNPYMISPTYVEFGCGVATDGNGRYYYICDIAYVAGGSYAPSDSSNQSVATPAPVMIPVTIAQPQPDGSVVHIIRTGQTLWTLAAIYNVPLAEILQLNNLPEGGFIHPGDEIIIKPAGSEPTSTPTQDPNITPTASVTATQPTPPSTLNATLGELAGPGGSAQTTPQAEPTTVSLSPEAQARAANTTVYWVVGAALFSIVGVFAASFFIRRPRPPEPPENDPFAPIE